MMVVLLYPGAFIGALSCAGIYSAIVFILFPSLIAWRGCYKKEPLAKGFKVKGGKPLLLGLSIAGLLFISNGIQIALT